MINRVILYFLIFIILFGLGYMAQDFFGGILIMLIGVLFLILRISYSETEKAKKEKAKKDADAWEWYSRHDHPVGPLR